MRYLRFKVRDAEQYPSQVDTLEIGLLAAGVHASRSDIILAWESYSDSMAAGWMTVNGIADAQFILPYLTEDV